MGIRGAGRVVLSALAMLLVTAGSASAAARFASPTGTPSASCLQASPCDIVTAVKSAATGDDITIEPGTYGSPTPLTTILSDANKALNIHGQAGQPRPVINTIASQGIRLGGHSTLSDVEIDDSAPAAYGFFATTTGASVDHVYSHASGAGGYACYPNTTMIDSVCWASGPNGIAVSVLVVADATGTLNNDTLIASGTGGWAVDVYGVSGATMTINMSNSIARGAGADVYAWTDTFSNSKAIFTASHSNYATVVNGGGSGTVSATAAGSPTNQTTPPLFVDAATGNFHELASSPTIDAGGDSPLNGTTDLDGNQRDVGIHTDIGAYEFISPPFCSNVSAVTKFATAIKIQLHCGDILSAPLTYAIASQPKHGTASLNASTGVVTYTPAAGYSGGDSFTYRVTSSHGTATASTASITVGAELPPGLSHVQYRHRKLSFTLSEAAKVTFVFTQRVHRHTRKRGTLTVSGKAGSNTHRFNGRLPHGKKLTPGNYTAIVTATNAGGKSKSARLSLKIAS
jgi:Bacterial Ig domain